MRLQKEKILITGGAGFIGSHLVDRLITEGYPVTVIDNLSSGLLENIHSKILARTDGCSFYHMDIRDSDLERVFRIEQPTYVYHIAAQLDLRFSVEDPLHDIDINIVGGINILKNSLREGVKKIIFASSGGTMYGELPENMKSFPCDYPPSPASPYGYSKFMMEKYLQFAQKAYGLDFVALRFSNVYGPRQGLSKESGVISIFTNKLFTGKPLIINGDGNQTRDFVYIDDCIDMFMRSIHMDIHGVFNVSTAQKTSVREITKMLSSYANIPSNIQYGDEKEGDVRHNCLDYSATKELTGWEPKVPIEEGIRKTLDWTRRQGGASSNTLSHSNSITRHWFHGCLWK